MTTLEERPVVAQEQEPDARWQAVLARDQRFDGTFVYGVRSTGVYCRPSCPSRRPGREQVVFYSGPKAAEEAGFRHCRRCRPDQPPTPDPQLKMVHQVCRHIQDNRDGPPTLAQLSGLVGASPGHLHRVFKRVMGITPRQYFDAFRQDRLKAQLREGRDVAGAMYDVGYGSSSRLYEGSSERLGMSPASYRRGGRGASIAYTTTACPLGRLLVAATGRGVCSVKLGDTDTELESALRQEYPAAELHPQSDAVGAWVEALLRHLEGAQPGLDLPLDIRATAYQRSVWEHLRAIPYGHTSSYQEVARALGQPGGARGVARACATNPVPLLVPCHRVVQQDGALGGYRWGVKRKAFLLDRERAPVNTAAKPAIPDWPNPHCPPCIVY